MVEKDSTRRGTRHGPRSWVARNAGLILLTVLAAYALLWPRHRPVQDMAQPAIAAKGHEAADLLFLAAVNLAEERGLAYTVLRSGIPASAEVRAAIAKRRRASDEAFRQAILLLKSGFAHGSDAGLTATVEDGLRAVDDMRTVVDRWYPNDARPELPHRWFATASQLIVFTGDLMQLVQIRIRSARMEPEVDVGLRLQHLALVMCDLAGRERALISGAIARREPVPRGVVNVLEIYRGRINRIWRTIASIASTHTLSPELRGIIADLERSYFGELEQTRRTLRRVAEAGSPYPLSATEWFGRSTKTIRIMIHLGEEAGYLARKATSSAVTRRICRPHRGPPHPARA